MNEIQKKSKEQKNLPLSQTTTAAKWLTHHRSSNRTLEMHVLPSE